MLDALKAKYRGATTFSFGNGPRMADDMLALIASGQKTASCGVLRDGRGGARMPAVGQYFIVKDGRRLPGAVIRVTEVSITTASEVSEALALATGPYHSRADWHSELTGYFGTRRDWSDAAPLVCWRFEVVEDLTQPAPLHDLVA